MTEPPNDTDNTEWIGRQELPPGYAELRHWRDTQLAVFSGQTIRYTIFIKNLREPKSWRSPFGGGPLAVGELKITRGSLGIR